METMLEDRACSRLFEIATPDLYRRNSFRILGLPVNVTMGEIRRRQTRLNMMRKVGIQVSGKDGGYLPLVPPPAEDDVRAAMQRLSDPECRLLDEFFWFWARDSGAREDEGLKLLAAHRINEAQDLWLKYENESSARTSTHNLAVLYHALALDLEDKSTSRPLTEKQLVTRRTGWQRAYKRWQRLMQDEGFWSRLKARIRELEDPRLTTGLARRIRDSLPKAILLINARLALRAAEQGKDDEASRHVTAMKDSGFGDALVYAALHECVSSIRNRIRMACASAETRSDTDAKNAGAIARSLINDSIPLLRIIDVLLPKTDVVSEGAHDEVANQALRCQVVHGRETDDWEGSLDILRRALPLARGSSVRDRLNENIKIVQANMASSVCFFCGRNKAQDSLAVEVKMHGDINRSYLGYATRLTWKTLTAKVPRCPQCKAYHGKSEMRVGLIVVLTLAAAVLGGIMAQHIVGAIIPAVIVAVGTSLIWRIKPPYKIRSSGDAAQYGPVKEMFDQGWKLGEKPAEAN